MTGPPQIDGGGVLGEKIAGARRVLDTFDMPKGVCSVEYVSDEVTAVCPITGQPDWYVVKINLRGSKKGIESKSLKLYLQSFREDGQFCEEFASTIAHDVWQAVEEPSSVGVQMIQKSRGGVSIIADAYLHGKEGV